MAGTALRKPKLTVGSLIDQMAIKRDERRVIAEQDKKLKSEYDELEVQLIEMMDKEGVTKSTGAKASAGISVSEQFNIEDFDTFSGFVIKTKMTHLFQRRLSTDAVREVYKLKGAVPGLTPFIKRGVNLRNL